MVDIDLDLDEDEADGFTDDFLCHYNGLPCRTNACVMWREKIPAPFREQELAQGNGDPEYVDPAFHCADVRKSMIEVFELEKFLLAQAEAHQRAVQAAQAEQAKTIDLDGEDVTVPPPPAPVIPSAPPPAPEWDAVLQKYVAVVKEESPETISNETGEVSPNPPE